MLEKILNKVSLVFYYCTFYILYKLRFKKLGKFSVLKKPLRLQGGNNIFIGNYVMIEKLCWLASDNRFGKRQGIIEIGDGAYIGNFAHIYSTGSISIAKKVMIADKVYIADNTHIYDDINLPIIDQKVSQLEHVTIGEGTWIGEHAVIIGAKIGRNSVVGANTVIRGGDFPDYCIIAGNPARIISKYNKETASWQ